MCSFFFFKQKTAYEIGVRLVGSEMCIRDRTTRVSAVTIRPNTVGAAFWQDEFLTSVRDGGKEKSDHDG